MSGIALHVVALLAVAAPQQDSLPPELRTAQAALDSGYVNEAIDLAEHYAYRHRDDVRGWLMVGDAYMARLPDGRFRGFEAYRKAKRAAPQDPERPCGESIEPPMASTARRQSDTLRADRIRFLV
jgi:cytochrome c-type biogenesis protein CcmH/NrfG